MQEGLIPGLGRSPGEGKGNPLQYSCLENPVDRGARWDTTERLRLNTCADLATGKKFPAANSVTFKVVLKLSHLSKVWKQVSWIQVFRLLRIS